MVPQTSLKIYRLPVNDTIRPSTGFIAPAHNQDYGVEQDFERWLLAHPEHLTDNPNEADWRYFPAYFNRFYCNHWGNRAEEVQQEMLRLITRAQPTFTICEYDIFSYYPDFDFCNMFVFTASRRGDNGSIDIPLLCSKHEDLPGQEGRRWLASFMGKFDTHSARSEMRQALTGAGGVYLSEGQGTRPYAELMADSYVALAPRGYGGQSFRFYEAMQFAAVPFLIGDLDTRPFKRWIDWDKFSLYTDDAGQIEAILSQQNRASLREMGQQARQLWENEVYYGKWCKYVLAELQNLSG